MSILDENVRGYIPLTHGLGLVYIVSPNIDTMSANEDGIRVGILIHGLLEKLGQILLVGSVFNHGDAQSVVVVEVARLLEPATKALDLLDVVDLKHLVVSGALGLEEQRHQHGPVRVRVDAAAGAALGEGGQEERRALRGPAPRGRAQVDAVLEVDLLGELQDVEVQGLHELLLHS